MSLSSCIELELELVEVEHIKLTRMFSHTFPKLDPESYPKPEPGLYPRAEEPELYPKPEVSGCDCGIACADPNNGWVIGSSGGGGAAAA